VDRLICGNRQEGLPRFVRNEVRYTGDRKAGDTSAPLDWLPDVHRWHLQRLAEKSAARGARIAPRTQPPRTTFVGQQKVNRRSRRIRAVRRRLACEPITPVGPN
jgi:hypothetical protein